MGGETMSIRRHVGYDEQVTYSTAELSAMYVSEGKAPPIALAMAQTLHKALKAMNQKEWRLWKKVREHEVRAGLIRTVEELEEAYKEESNAVQIASAEEEVLCDGSPGGTEEGNRGRVGSSDPEREETPGSDREEEK